MSYEAELTPDGWAVSPIVDPNSGTASPGLQSTLGPDGYVVDPLISPLSGLPSPGYTKTLTEDGWIVDPIPNPGDQAQDALSRWKSGGIAGKNLVMWGDSTTEVAIVMWEILNNELKTPGGRLAGANIINAGVNGQTLAGATVNIDQLYALAPDLVVACWGLNDVRLGGVDAVGMQDRIETMMALVRGNLPNTDIVLWTPNSMLSTDPTSSGFVVPVSAAQDYTDAIWGGYNAVVGQYEHTLSVDKMEIFGRTCQPTSALMTDILHPSNDGQRAQLAQLLPLIEAPALPIDEAASAAAWLADPAAPWTIYSRALEDTRYATEIRRFLITLYLDGGPNALTLYCAPAFGSTTIATTDFAAGNLIWTPNGVYTMTGAENNWQMAPDFVQLGAITTADFPPNAPPLYNAKIYQRVAST